MEHRIREVRMGNQSIVERPGHRIRVIDDRAYEFNETTNLKTKELWLSAGAFIVYRES